MGGAEAMHTLESHHQRLPCPVAEAACNVGQARPAFEEQLFRLPDPILSRLFGEQLARAPAFMITEVVAELR